MNLFPREDVAAFVIVAGLAFFFLWDRAISVWREQAEAIGPAEVEVFPESPLKPFGEQPRSTRLQCSIPFRARSLLYNRTAFLWSPSGASKVPVEVKVFSVRVLHGVQRKNVGGRCYLFCSDCGP